MVITIYPVFVCKTKRGSHQSLISFIDMLRLHRCRQVEYIINTSCICVLVVCILHLFLRGSKGGTRQYFRLFCCGSITLSPGEVDK